MKNWNSTFEQSMPHFDICEDTHHAYQNFLIFITFIAMIPMIIKIVKIGREKKCKRESLGIYAWTMFIQSAWILGALFNKTLFAVVTNGLNLLFGIVLVTLIFKYGTDD